MMSKNISWSPNQQLAIDTPNANTLVSAGAGSGKTAVLTERIYQLIKKGNDITKFLVMTFTNAAAVEMKERVRKKILEDPILSNRAFEIENAHIETFDAFCLFLVKKYANLLNVSPNVSVIDSSILNIQIKKIRDQIFEEYYEKSDETFTKAIGIFCLKDDNQVKELITSIYTLANLQIDKEKFYANFESNYLADSNIENWIDLEYKSILKQISDLIEIASNLDNLVDSENTVAFLKEFEKAKDYDDFFNISARMDKTPTSPRGAACAAKSFINDTIKNLRKPSYGDSTFIKEKFNEYKPFCLKLLEMAIELDKRVINFEKEYNAYSFADIAKMALKVLSYKEVSEEMKNYFDFVMVDEYQDTSDIQEAVINAVSKDNVYCVGDVKQSIYRFRNANCTIFNDKYENYKNSRGGTKIDLNESFRSRKSVVDAINDIFSKLMVRKTNLIDYNDGHNFGYGNHDYDSLGKEDDYSFDICKYTVDENESKFDHEMGIITSDIINKVNSGYKVYDKDSRKLRNCTFSDFAIIIDRATKFEEIKEYFSNKGIPIKAIKDEELKDSAITYVTKSLIKLFICIKENEFSDEFRHAYISLARSFLVSENDKDIFLDLNNDNHIELSLTQKIKKVVDLYKNKSLFEILRGLYDEFDIDSKIPSIGNCSSNMHKCDVFLGFAQNMDSLGYSIKDMGAYFDDLTTYDLSISYSDSSEDSDAVTLITIHKSKGLEYPIVYFPCLGVKFNRNQNSSSFFANQKYGIVLPLTGNTNFDSFLSHLIKKDENKDDFEEKLRLLYVAITRVREKAILLIQDKFFDKVKVDVTTSNHFANILTTTKLDKYIKNYAITGEKLKNIKPIPQQIGVNVKSINIPANVVKTTKASKSKTLEVENSLLEFGSKLHYILEIANYETKDLGFVKDQTLIRYVQNVLNSELFDDISNAKILHEYSFFDDENKVNGVIDCLVIRNSYVDIIDFKLKKINDEEYDEQLRIYANYVKKITKLPIKMHLISAYTGEVKEIV